MREIGSRRKIEKPLFHIMDPNAARRKKWRRENMRIVFMGTPEIAAVILDSMLDKEYEVAAVVTQPDRPKGRGKEIAFSEVKKLAIKHNIPVYQPARARDQEFVDALKQLAPELIVVVAFGQILPKEILELPKYGCINVHASLLPKYRGASPIQWAIINGDRTTGVTIMYMAEGIDTGDMITKELVEIAPDETAGSLHDKLAQAGCTALHRAIEQITSKTAVRTPQDESQAVYVGMLKKEMGHIDFQRSAQEIERLVRGLSPWPSTYAALEGKMLKFWRCEAAELTEEQKQIISEKNWECGTVVAVEKDSFFVLASDSVLIVKELQIEGKRRMGAEEFLRGNKVEPGQILR